MTITYSLSDGTEILIDEEDVHLLAESGWHLQQRKHCCYVGRYIYGLGKTKLELLHRRILGLAHAKHPFIDHRDGNGLNNTRANLRICTHQQNLRNQRRRQRGKTSRFKGVYWNGEAQKWHARIGLDGRRLSLGYFEREEEAARAYNDAAARMFQEFACPNLVDS